jgi:hypothetical protein
VKRKKTKFNVLGHWWCSIFLGESLDAGGSTAERWTGLWLMRTAIVTVLQIRRKLWFFFLGWIGTEPTITEANKWPIVPVLDVSVS